MIVAFDVDGTLIDENDQPRPMVVALAKVLLSYARSPHGSEESNMTVVIWSGGGTQYARMWADRLGLGMAFCYDKHDALRAGLLVDLAIDDVGEACLARQMLLVGKAMK